MKKILITLFLLFGFIGFSQDLSMQNGTFERCAPDRFFDSGGEFGNYSNNENFVTTICPQNIGEFIILDFTAFSTQTGLNQDVMNIYDGTDTSASLLGSYDGPVGPFTVSASDTNASGCLTIEFISGASGNTLGWQADILCAVACQTITASVDSTIPAESAPNVIEILPGETVDFTGSATFSVDGTGATYEWDFDNGSLGSGTNVSSTYNTPGTYTVTLTVTDTNPVGCEDTTTISVIVLDPIVTVNSSAYPESSFSPEELIENVLVSGGCSAVDNFSFQVNGNPGDLDTKSYGYFTRGGATNFPFENGIILTTGVASQAGNTASGFLVSNDNNQAGDNDLEAALMQTNTNDATFIKFNFIPTSNEISFRYLMASEEYDGSTECSFADSFAFLLREVGTVPYTNLAVLPDGTPVSVTNINNSGVCTDNPAFFEGYNIGETNYGGRTVVLTATATVVPNTVYEIKLVVADQGDSIWDSAIFLEAGSFNLGGDLGEDITIAAGTAECGGNSITLDTDAPTATHTWFFNNVEIPGETSSTIDVTESGIYSVDVEFAVGCETSDSIFVEFKPSPVANTAPPLVICDTDGTAEFDLSENDDDILGVQNPADFIISYHLTEQDAIDNVGALPINYTNISNPQPIWARIADNTQECYATTSFELQLTSIIIDNAIPPIELCDDDIADGFTEFDLTVRDLDVIGSNNPAEVTVSYHLTLADSENNANALSVPFTNTDTFNQTVYVRLERIDNSACYNLTTLDLEVLPNPTANVTTPLEACDDDNDGFAEFDLSIKDAEVIGVQTGVVVSYYDTQAEAELGNNPLPINYTNIVAGSQGIFVRVEDTATGCYDTTTLQLVVNPRPAVVAVSPYELCDDNNAGDEQELFDLPTKDAEVINGQVNVTVSYYENQTDADAGINAITALYANTSNPQTVVAVLTNTLTGCSSSVSFDLVVNPLPALIDPTPLEVCDDGVPDGLTAIDLSIKNAEITGNNPNYSVSYYGTQADADAEVNPLPTLYTNTTNPETVFVRVEDINTGCYDTTTLDLVVEQAPVANTPNPLLYCDPDNDGFGLFTLTDVDNEITGGAPGLTVSYHETFANADNNVDAIDTTVTYSNIVINTQTLYVRVESSTIATACATIVELQLIVEPTPQLVDPTPLEECDDISADGFATFDLTTKAAEVLNGQDPTQYIVSYYGTEANANAGTNAIANPNAYTNTVANIDEVWIRVEDNMTAGGCYKVVRLELIVNPLPVLVQPAPLELCDAVTLEDEQEGFTLEDANAEILNGQTGISLSYYETQADADAAMNPVFSPYVNTSNPQTIYVRAENDLTGCYNTITVTLRVDPLPSPEDNPTPIEVCDDDNDGFAEFDLEVRTQEIINGEPDVEISYHETQTDAEMGDNPIVGLYTNIVANTQFVYVRAENTLTGCYSLTLNPLELIVQPSPQIPMDLEPLVICDTNSDGIAQFDLTLMDAAVLNGQDATQVELTYHETQADAESGDDPIINVGNYTNNANPQTIYVRLYNPTTMCQDTGEFELQVELPPVAVQPTPLELCDDLGESPGDEMTEFDLTVKDAEITGGNASWSVAYYETDADAQAQINAIPDPTQYTNTSVDNLPANPQTLYVVVTDTDTGCVDFTTLTIRVLPNPTPTESDQIPDLVLCDDINTGDGVEVFNLLGLDGDEAQQDLILNDEAGVTASYYETAEDADAGINAIADPENYTNIESPDQEIYVRVTNDVTGCYTLVNFTITVNPLPDVVAVTDFIQCELNTDGFDSFDLTTKDAEVLNGQDPIRYVVSYHETLADAQSQSNGLVSPYMNQSNPQQIFVTITDTVTGCYISTQSFNLQVDEAAEANPDLDPYELCDDNMETDGDPSNDSVQFDLSTQNDLVLGDQDAASYIVSYYANEIDANLNVNPLPTLYENVINPQVIYVRVDNNTLTVVPIALDLGALTTGLDLDADGTIDTYDTDNDGSFDLVDVDGDGISDAIDTNADGIIDFIDVDGDGLGDPVDLDNNGTFDNQQDGSICYAVAPLTLQVNPLPEFGLDESYILCVNTNGTEVLSIPVLDTGLSDTDYSFEWSYNNEVIVSETGSSLVPTQGGTYSVRVTDNATGCDNFSETLVIESEPPSLTASQVTQLFGQTNVIEAIATGMGDYEYSLDGGPWQDSGIFTGVSAGQHEITARDKIGCGFVTYPVFVVDYPLYFTPNGDGNNDTWKIEGIGSNAKIYIFDRYGKLLKQLSPTGQGWDGTFNGNLMPTSDYWFIVEYNEPLTGKRKEFKAHFTLKR